MGCHPSNPTRMGGWQRALIEVALVFQASNAKSETLGTDVAFQTFWFETPANTGFLVLTHQLARSRIHLQLDRKTYRNRHPHKSSSHPRSPGRMDRSGMS